MADVQEARIIVKRYVVAAFIQHAKSERLEQSAQVATESALQL